MNLSLFHSYYNSNWRTKFKVVLAVNFSFFFSETVKGVMKVMIQIKQKWGRTWCDCKSEKTNFNCFWRYSLESLKPLLHEWRISWVSQVSSHLPARTCSSEHGAMAWAELYQTNLQPFLRTLSTPEELKNADYHKSINYPNVLKIHSWHSIEN